MAPYDHDAQDDWDHSNLTAVHHDQVPHDYTGTKHMVIIWTLTGLATLFLGLRIYCRQWRLRGLWWDDYILSAAWVTLVVRVGIATKQLEFDLGRHIWDLDTFDYTDDFELFNLIGITFITCGMAWSKTAFAVTLLRISEGKLRSFLWFVIVTINVFMASGVLVRWLQCWPIQKGWEPNVDGGCWDEAISINLSISTGGMSSRVPFSMAQAR